HALFNSESFERVTDDGFFLSVEAADPHFDREETEKWLLGLGATRVEAIAH
ncbi:MAG: DUF3341 domain-containing protein, partial [Acidobacteria bacterium]|nr:DUF3341 domain-containing protein [Acidobacteriota bacterium]